MSLFSRGRLSICLSICTLLLLSQLATPRAAAAQSVIHTGLGDSIAFGLFAPIGGGYVLAYGRDFQADTGINVTTVNLGIPGWTSSDLLNAIQGDFLFRLSVATSSVITLDIGGNDLLVARGSYGDGTCGGADNQDCFRSAVAAFKSNWNGILAEILSLRSTSDTVIRVMNVYNPYVDEDRARDSWPNDQGNDFLATRAYLDDLNNHITTTSAALNIPCALVYQSFNGPNGDHDPREQDLIAFDGLHPNGNGHTRIAELFRALGYAPLQ